MAVNTSHQFLVMHVLVSLVLLQIHMDLFRIFLFCAYSVHSVRSVEAISYWSLCVVRWWHEKRQKVYQNLWMKVWEAKKKENLSWNSLSYKMLIKETKLKCRLAFAVHIYCPDLLLSSIGTLCNTQGHT